MINRVYVVPPQNALGNSDFAGLCGNFNGLDDDDFTMLDNSRADNELEFAHSWSDQDAACEYPYEQDSCKNANGTDHERKNFAVHCKFSLFFLLFPHTLRDCIKCLSKYAFLLVATCIIKNLNLCL